MMRIEFPLESQEQVTALALAHPEHVKQVTSRHSIGGGTDLTLLISLAGLAIPAIKDVLVAHIRAGQYKYVSYKNLKIRGQSPEDIEKILASLRDSGLKL
jgi:hypothetical protein